MSWLMATLEFMQTYMGDLLCISNGSLDDLPLPMSVAHSPDIFQTKMSWLMTTLEFMQTFLDDLLCISKGSLDDHLAKL